MIERRIVIPEVAGLSPVIHPKFEHRRHNKRLFYHFKHDKTKESTMTQPTVSCLDFCKRRDYCTGRGYEAHQTLNGIKLITPLYTHEKVGSVAKTPGYEPHTDGYNFHCLGWIPKND